jgi:transposase
MARACSICTGEQRATIDKMLLKGATDVDVSKQFGMHRLTVSRHRRHIQSQIETAARRRSAKLGDQHLEVVLGKVDKGDQWLEEALEALKLETSDGGKVLSPDGALAVPKFVKELRSNQELRAKLHGLLKDAGGVESGPQIMIVVPPAAQLGAPSDLSIPGIQDQHGRLLTSGQSTQSPQTTHSRREEARGDSADQQREDLEILDAEFESPQNQSLADEGDATQD